MNQKNSVLVELGNTIPVLHIYTNIENLTNCAMPFVCSFRALQIAMDTKMSELQNDVKLKTFETERTQMVYEETVRNQKEVSDSVSYNVNGYL